ncbi:hypothetical protein K6L59_03400 [Candidatus Phytoplasma sp. Tabriz.2]|nr:hypothetical protein [Candidatus Phytoplasma australiense]
MKVILTRRNNFKQIYTHRHIHIYIYIYIYIWGKFYDKFNHRFKTI